MRGTTNLRLCRWGRRAEGAGSGQYLGGCNGGEFLEAYGVDFSQITGKLKKIHRDFSHPTNTKLFKKVHGLVDPSSVSQSIVKLVINSIYALEPGGSCYARWLV